MPYFLLRISDIPTEGRDLNAHTDSDAWFKKVVREAVSDDANSFEATLSAKMGRMERSIEITGGVYLKTEVECSRCLEDFSLEQQIPFRFLLEPVPQGGIPKDEEEDLSDVLDFSYYDGDEIDVGDLIRQHIVISRPMNHVCKKDCKGLCPQCGKNLNKGGCRCRPEEAENPFSVLKGIKPRSP